MSTFGGGLTEEAQATEKNTTYDLVANIVHDRKATEGGHVFDTRVTGGGTRSRIFCPRMIPLWEACIQIWKRQQTTTKQ